MKETIKFVNFFCFLRCLLDRGHISHRLFVLFVYLYLYAQFMHIYSQLCDILKIICTALYVVFTKVNNKYTYKYIKNNY